MTLRIKLGNYVFRRAFLCMQNWRLWTCAFLFRFHEISFCTVWSSAVILCFLDIMWLCFFMMFFFWMYVCTSGSISSSFLVSHWIFCSPSLLDLEFQWCHDNVCPRKSERVYQTFSTWHMWFSSYFLSLIRKWGCATTSCTNINLNFIRKSNKSFLTKI